LHHRRAFKTAALNNVRRRLTKSKHAGQLALVSYRINGIATHYRGRGVVTDTNLLVPIPIVLLPNHTITQQATLSCKIVGTLWCFSDMPTTFPLFRLS